MAFLDLAGTARQFTVRRGSIAGRALAALLKLDAGYRQQRHLADLSDHLLEDVGLTRTDRAKARTAWDAPTVMLKR